MNEQSVFLAAVEIADPSRRADFLDEACAGDHLLRMQVDALLVAHERSGDFLEVPVLKQIGRPPGAPDRDAETSAEHHASQEEMDLSFLEPLVTPRSVGRLRHYEIRELIDRGGCGIVLKAFDEKLERIVAIKIMAAELAATSPPINASRGRPAPRPPFARKTWSASMQSTPVRAIATKNALTIMWTVPLRPSLPCRPLSKLSSRPLSRTHSSEL